MKNILFIKKVLLSFIVGMLLFTSTTFANLQSIDLLKSQFSSLLFTTLKADLNIDKDALIKDSNLEKEIDEYIENAVIKGLTAPEFQKELSKEISSFKKNNPDFSGLKVSENDNKKNSEYLNIAISMILERYDIKKDDLLLNNDFNIGIWKIIDEFKTSSASKDMDFKEYFQEKLDNYDSYKEGNTTEAFLLYIIPLIVAFPCAIALFIYRIKMKKNLV